MSRRIKDLKQLAKALSEKAYMKPNTFKVELEDHLNVSLSSSNKLGRFLDPGYGHYFDYPGLGPFRSPLNLVYWLRDPSKNDLLRGLKRRDLNKVIYGNRFPKLSNHQAILLKAMEIRLRTRGDLIKMIKELPDKFEILSYKVHPVTKIRITTGYASIVIPVVEELIKAVKEDRDVDYSRFINKKTNGKVPFIEMEEVSKEEKLQELIQNHGRETDDGKVIVEKDGKKMTISPEGIEYENFNITDLTRK